jgi:hypothetical protein
MKSARTIIGLAVAFGALACSDSTGPATPKATVTVGADIIGVTRKISGTSSWLDFSIPVMVTNHGMFPIEQPDCVFRVESLAGNEWKTTYNPICALTSTVVGSRTILPGETREFMMRVFASVEGTSNPQWKAPAVDGTYRVSVGLMPPSDGGPIPFVASNSFEIREGLSAGQP